MTSRSRGPDLPGRDDLQAQPKMGGVEICDAASSENLGQDEHQTMYDGGVERVFKFNGRLSVKN